MNLFTIAESDVYDYSNNAYFMNVEMFFKLKFRKIIKISDI